MKEINLFMLACAMSLGFTPGALANTKAQSVIVPEEGWVTVYTQDFSGMPAGTSDTPDEEQLADLAYDLSSQYLGDEGWTGYGIYQAGEACALNCPNFGGFINTPETDLPGLIRVSFKLKSLDPIGTGKVMACRGGINNPRQVDTEASLRQFDTDGWQDYEFYFYNSTKDKVFVQINTVYYANDKKGIVIDDLKVEYNPTYLPLIQAVSTTSFSNDSFSVNWIPQQTSADADYLVSLYCEEKKGNDGVKADEDFSTWTVDSEGRISKASEGWNIVKMYPNHSGVVEFMGKKGLGFGHHEEIIELPSNGGRFTELSFDVINLKGENPEAWGAQIQVQGWNGNNWVPILSPSAYGMDENATERYDLGAWEDAGPDMYDPTIPAFRGLYSKIRFRCESANYGAILMVTNLHYETTVPTETVCLKKDVVSKETSISFAGLDMSKVHWVGIKTRDNGNHSGEAFYEPYGIAIPVIKEPTNVTESGYTANWEEVANAGSYIISYLNCKEVTETIEDYAIVLCDLADLKVGNSNYYDPTSIGNSYDLTDLSEYIDKGWTGAGNVVVDGALGCRGSYMPGMYGILSPELHLSNDGGKCTFNATVWGSAYSSLSIGTSAGVTESEIFENDGEKQITMTIEGCRNHDSIAIFSTDGQPFFIKNFSITQNLVEGDKIIVSSFSEEVPAGISSLEVEASVADGFIRAYDVAAYREDFTRESFSGYSELKVVPAPSQIREVNLSDNSICVSGSEITIRVKEIQTVMVAGIDGQTVYSNRIYPGTTAIRVPNPGVYIVGLGNERYKVFCK